MIENGRHFLHWRSPRRIVASNLPDVVLGIGLPSYLSAAILAFSNERSCGFVRTKVKAYGLMAEVEEPLPVAQRRSGLVDLEGLADEALRQRYTRIEPPLQTLHPSGLLARPAMTKDALLAASSQVSMEKPMR